MVFRIMIHSAFTRSTESYLVLFPPSRIIATDFVEIMYEATLEHYYYHHNNYEHLILMEDGALVHRSNAQKYWQEYLGLKKLKWPKNSRDLNPLKNIWKQVKN